MSIVISSPKAPRSSHHRSASGRSVTSPRHNRIRSYDTTTSGSGSPRSARTGSPTHNRPNLNPNLNPQTSPSRGFPNRAVPNYEYEGPAAVPENLHDPQGTTLNVDPAMGVLHAGGETYQAPVPPAGRRRFVGGFGGAAGGFVGGLRKVWGRQRGTQGAVPMPVPLEEQLAAEEQEEAEVAAEIAFPQPAVIHEEEELEAEYGEPALVYSQTDPMLGDERYSAASPMFGRDPYAQQYAASAQYASPPRAADRDAQYFERTPHDRQDSSSSTAETVHATTQEHFEGTTIVNHEPRAPDATQFGSPQFVEPQPGSDYAKMDAPPSETSFGSYISRIGRFARTVRELPWVAPERVTADYVPRGAREQMAMEEAQNATLGVAIPRPGGRGRSARRKRDISWYNSNVPQGSVDLLAGGTSSPFTDFGQAKEMPTSPTGEYEYGATPKSYANNLPVRTSAAPGPPPPSMPMPMAGASPRSPQRTPKRAPRRVPVPRYSPDIDGPPGSGTYRPPRYPLGGYVPYEQLEPHQMAQSYTGSSMSSVSSLPPTTPGVRSP